MMVRQVVASILVVVGAFAPATAQAPRFKSWSEHNLWTAAGGDFRVADLNDDGYFDVVARGGQLFPCGPQLLLGNGRGTFEERCAQKPSFFHQPAWSAAVGDVDGDGDLDIIQPNTQLSTLPAVPDLLWLNDGRANFQLDTAGRLPLVSSASWGCDLADFDRDNDLDLVIWNGKQQSQLLLNIGAGFFSDVTSTHMPFMTEDTRNMAIGDLDGDGDLDIVSVAWGNLAPWRILLNDGQGRFTDSQFASGYGLSVRLGDVDGDGDLDVMVGTDQGSVDELHLNDGRGNFMNATNQLPSQLSVTYGGDLVDLDGDGDLDFISGTPTPARIGPRIWLNDGRGWFTDVTATSFVTGMLGHGAYNVRAGDFDGDGDIDFIANFDGIFIKGRVFMNITRHVHAPASDGGARTYEIEVDGLAGHVFLPVVAARSARYDLPPLGIWRMDPAASIVLPPMVIPPSGSTKLKLILPTDPTLSSLDVHVQAADFDPVTKVLHFTGWGTTRLQ